MTISENISSSRPVTYQASQLIDKVNQYKASMKEPPFEDYVNWLAWSVRIRKEKQCVQNDFEATRENERELWRKVYYLTQQLSQHGLSQDESEEIRKELRCLDKEINETKELIEELEKTNEALSDKVTAVYLKLFLNCKLNL
jgi:septal ring factor EnvC (AmiA/AmiB activator)